MSHQQNKKESDFVWSSRVNDNAQKLKQKKLEEKLKQLKQASKNKKGGQSNDNL